jgi:GxxExxY protein
MVMDNLIMAEILYKEESFKIMGACFEVYNDKGPGFLEAVYQECLSIEFELRNVPVLPQAELRLTYKGRELTKMYQPDFLCFDTIILEIKACSSISDEHRAQVHNYLKATNRRLGILVNFGSRAKLQYERIVR